MDGQHWDLLRVIGAAFIAIVGGRYLLREVIEGYIELRRLWVHRRGI